MDFKPKEATVGRVTCDGHKSERRAHGGIKGDRVCQNAFTPVPHVLPLQAGPSPISSPMPPVAAATSGLAAMHLKVAEESESKAGSTEGDKWGGAGKSRLCEDAPEGSRGE